MKLSHKAIPQDLINLFLTEVSTFISDLSGNIPEIDSENYEPGEFILFDSKVIPNYHLENHNFLKFKYFIAMKISEESYASYVFSYYSESAKMFITIDEEGDYSHVVTHNILLCLVEDYDIMDKKNMYPNISSEEYIEMYNKKNKIFKKLNENNLTKVGKIIEVYKNFISNYYSNLDSSELTYITSYLIFNPTSNVEYLIKVLEYDDDETPYKHYAQIVNGKVTTKFSKIYTENFIRGEDVLINGFERNGYLKEYSYDDWKKEKTKLNNIFKKLNESNETDIKTTFFEFITNNEFGNLENIHAEDILPNYDDDSDYSWTCKLVKINDKYYLISEETDQYEETRNYYIYLKNDFYELSETDKHDLVEKHGIGLVENVKVLEDIEFSYWYKTTTTTMNKIFKKLNEKVSNKDILNKFHEFATEHFSNDISATEDDMFDRYNRLGYEWRCQLLDVRHINDLKYMYYIAVSESGTPRDTEKEFYVYDEWSDRFEYYEDDEFLEKTLYITDPIELESKDYKEWVELRRKTVNIFKKLNEGKEDNLIDWLNTKFDGKISKKLGFGQEGIVYEYDTDKAIKLTHDKINHYNKLVNKDIKGIAKIYDIGYIYPPKRFISNNKLSIIGDKLPKTRLVKDFKSLHNLANDCIERIDDKVGYIIMEKVTTGNVNKTIDKLVKDISSVVLRDHIIEHLSKDLHMAYENSYRSENAFNIIYEMLLHSIDDTIKLLQKFNVYSDDMKQLVTSLVNVGRYFPDWKDIYSEQFGINAKKELVAFDLGDINQEEVIKKPKNIIREFLEFKNTR